MQLLIHRFYTDNNTSTVGKLIVSDIVYTLDSIKNMSLANFNLLPNLYSCYTIELDWKDNKRNISCIPANIYNVELIKSPKFKEVLHVKDVPNRSGILIHIGNSHVNIQGCLLPISRIEISNNVYGVNSKLAFDNIMKFKTNIKSLIIIDNVNL